MDVLMELLYGNIGKKLKILAVVGFILEALVSVLASFISLIGGSFVGALISLIVGPVVGFIASWPLYAFGDLVEKTNESAYNSTAIIGLLSDLKNKENAEKTQTSEIIPLVVDEKKPTIIETKEKRVAAVKKEPMEQTDDTFVSGKAYHKGDVVKFSGKWYACAYEGAIGTVWDPKQNPKHWVETDEPG